MNTFDELGKTVFDGFLQIRPQNSAKLIIEYDLPFGASGNQYPLLIQKQGGTRPFSYEVKVNGKTKEKFGLDADKQLNLSI